MLDNYQELLRKLEKLKTRKAEAGGELKVVLSELKKFGIGSLKECSEKLPDLQQQARDLAVEYTTAKQNLEDEFKDQLEGL